MSKTIAESVRHTPGPWHIGMKPGPIVYGPQGEQVANMLPCMLERDEHNANVRLIAAAPALLEALAALVNCPDYRNIQTHEMNEARALLATITIPTPHY